MSRGLSALRKAPALAACGLRSIAGPENGRWLQYSCSGTASSHSFTSERSISSEQHPQHGMNVYVSTWSTTWSHPDSAVLARMSCQWRLCICLLCKCPIDNA